MSFNHEAVAALPVASAADKALIRALATRRFAYVLAADESAQDFVAVDPASGVIPLYLIQNSTLFAYDSTDSTTTHDGVTCLVSFEGKRFKAETIAPPYSVLTRDTTAQPASPTVGDRYLIPVAATGTDWAGQDGKIGVYTPAGWRFAISPVGRLLHVEDEESFYHRDVSGVWTPGLGSILFAAGSVNITNVLGAKASFVVKVENQTTNAPPASPVAPVAYIIGPSPTGDWSGNAGKLAVCLVDDAFTIITPDEGDQVWDKALNIPVTFNGTAWESSAGAMVGRKSVRTVSGSEAFLGTGNYTYSSSTAPDAGTYSSYRDGHELTYAARAVGNILHFRYRYSCPQNTFTFTIGLFRDFETDALDWHQMANSSLIGGSSMFEIVASDTTEHDYSVRIFPQQVVSIPNATKRIFTVEEYVP